MNIEKMIQKIEKHFARHGASIKLKLHKVVGDYERYIFSVKLNPGTRENLFFERAPDIRTALQLPLFQPFEDGLALYLAVSEKPVTGNRLLEMLNSQVFHQSRMWLPIALGYDLRNEMFFIDLGKLPHALYAGSTNSGKSVGLICLILSLVCKQPVNRANLILVGVGANSFDTLSGLPHLSHPIVKDTETGIYVIQSLAEEMERRIKLDGGELYKLPAIICVIDEYVSFAGNIRDKKLSSALASDILNLLSRGRHAKIHMVLATQDPTKNTMKNNIGNITARMAFACAKHQDSATILGKGGAEKLPGKGAMLFKSGDYPESMYVQGAYITPDETELLAANIASKPHDMSNKFVIPEIDISQSEILTVMDACTENRERELTEIILWALGRESISKLQIMQQFHMSNRVDAIMDTLFEMRLVAEKNANLPRAVIPESIEDIPADVTAFLTENGVTGADIETAFMGRE